MNVIRDRDRDGKVIHKSRNLRGIRVYVRLCRVKAIDITQFTTPDGKLSILFVDGSSYETNFASFNVLKGFVARWKNVRGAPLTVNGEDAGTVSLKNPKLR